jgi:hypothetical protein
MGSIDLRRRSRIAALGGRYGRAIAAIIVGAIQLAIVGCASSIPPPEATVSPLSATMRPAKAPYCPMPLLYERPVSAYKQLAIVDAWGDETAKDSEVMRVLKRKACEAGADAVVITSNKKQEEGDLLPGYGPGAHTEVNGEQAGVNVSQREHAPTIGELGHSGHYISGIAIIYRSNDNSAASTAANGH